MESWLSYMHLFLHTPILPCPIFFSLCLLSSKIYIFNIYYLPSLPSQIALLSPKAGNLHQILERGDLSEVKLHQGVEQPERRRLGVTAPLVLSLLPWRLGLGLGLQSPGAPGRSRRRARRSESSPRLASARQLLLP